MFFKKKRVQGIFLAFLVTFTHSSFPISWGIIVENTSSCFVRGFKEVDRFLGTNVGASLGSLVSLCVFAIIFQKVIDFNTREKVTKHEKKKKKKKLSFKNDYVGPVPRVIKSLMSQIKEKSDYAVFGVNTEKGILIVGPPGVGKTFLIKILADEVDATMYVVDGAKVKGGRYRGAGSGLVREVFDYAENDEKHSIILIDEFDAISDRSDTEAQKTLLTQMDGFYKNTTITVIGLTNRPDKLDNAILRRFKVMEIGLPSESTREDFLKFRILKHLASKKAQKNCYLDNNIDFGKLAKATNGFSQDTLKSVVNSVFTRVVEHKSYPVTIKERAFKLEIQCQRSQIELGKINFLKESSEPMSEEAQRMYS